MNLIQIKRDKRTGRFEFSIMETNPTRNSTGDVFNRNACFSYDYVNIIMGKK